MLEESHYQSPSFIMLVGKKTKSAVLQHLLGDAAGGNFLVNVHNQIYLWEDPKTCKNTSPILFINCKLQNYSSSQLLLSHSSGEIVMKKIS